ncbi:MAG: hypothetical protein V2A70_04190, partial [Candidatus Omnitrophota bacterium]
MGINTTIPVGKLEINAGAAAPSRFVNVSGAFADLDGTRAGIYVNAVAATVGAYGAMGSWSQVRATDTAGNYTSALSGSYAEATQEGTATVDNLVGSLTLANQISNGPVTNAFGVYPQVWKGAGTITNAYGMYYQGVPTANGDTGVTTGILVNQYGVAIGNLTTATTRNVALLLDDNTTGAAATGSYGVLQESTVSNSFAGNVGVGTTDVSAQLTLHSAGPMLRDVRWNKDTTGAAANESQYIVGTTAVNRPAPSDIQKFKFFAGYGAFQEVGQIAVTMPTALGGVPQGAIDFSTQGLNSGLAQRMVIDSNIYMAANVGIGSSSPARLLEVGINPTIPAGSTPVVAVKGDVAVDGKIYGDASALTGLPSGISGLTTNALPKASSATTLVDSGVYVDANGNVGIGTISPVTTLETLGNVTITSIGNPSLLVRQTAPFSYNEMFSVHGGSGVIYLNKGGGYTTVANSSDLGGRMNISSLSTASGRVPLVLTGVVSQTVNLFEVNSVGDLSGDRFVITSNGNIGIATIVPRAKLELVGSGSTTGTAFQIDDSLYNPKVTVLDNGNVGIGTTSPNAKLELSVANGDGISLGDRGVDGTLWVGRTQSGSLTGNSARIGFLEPVSNLGTIVFNTNGNLTVSERMRIDQEGNIGVGTAAPVAMFHVGKGNPSGTADLSSNSALIKGNLEVDGKIYGDGSQITGVAGAVSGLTNYSVPRSQVDGKTLIDSGIYMDANGNVGIGTTVPVARLQIDSSRVIGLQNLLRLAYANNATSGGQIDFWSGNAAVVGRIQNAYSSSASTYFSFYTYNGVLGERARIDSNGNVGVGTTAPVANLHVGAGSPSPGIGADLTSNSALIKGNLEVDGKIYGDGSALTGISGAITGLSTYAVPRASSATTIVDSGIYLDVNGNVGIGTTRPVAQVNILKADSSALTDILVSPIVKTSGNLIDLQVGGASKFYVQSNGIVVVPNTLVANILNTSNLRPNADETTLNLAARNFTGSSGIQTASQIIPIINQSGTAGWIGLLVNPSLTGVGSGSQVSAAFMNGKVGVGTTAPVARLEVVGAGSTTGTAFQIDDNLYNPKVTVLDNGNVGLGTVDPNTLLQIGGSTANANAIITFGKTVATGEQNLPTISHGKVLSGASNDLLLSATSTSGGIVLKTLGVVRAVVNASGYFGIGITAPVASLHVGAGSPILGADLSSDSALIRGNLEVDGIIYGNGSQITNVAGAVSGLTNYSVPRSQSDGKTLIDSGIYTDANGNLGIGMTSPQYVLDVVGTIHSSISISTPSTGYFASGNWALGNAAG